MRIAKGQKVLIRTITHYLTGEIVKVTRGWIYLADAAWIADTGRFSECLRTGHCNEVEPAPRDCVVARGAIVDVYPWDHELPRAVK